MKTIYSIVSISLNTALNEKVSIGLLLSSGKKSMFKYSSDKLLAIKGLVSSDNISFVRDYLKSLEKDINKVVEPLELFENTPLKSDWVSEPYINYLSKYSNILIQFSEPKIIDIEFTPDNFKRIFEKYIYSYSLETEVVNSESVFTKVKNQLYPKIDIHVNLDKSLDSTHFENLFAPIEVNFIGNNGIPVVGQAIDFEKKHYNLENDVARLVSLTKAIELKVRKKGQYFILGQEPKIEEVENHSLWKQIRDSDFLEFVDIDEVEIVEQYIKENNVSPYFSK